MKIKHEIRHGKLEVFVTAPIGTHHSTIASAVLKYVRELEQPQYVSSVTGTKDGNWSIPSYAGQWKRVGYEIPVDTDIRKYFICWPVPS